MSLSRILSMAAATNLLHSDYSASLFSTGLTVPADLAEQENSMPSSDCGQAIFYRDRH